MEIEKLRKEVERVTGMEPKTPNDFARLSERVFERTHERISATTLKRLFGYLNEQVAPRAFTLDVLARFVGYRDYRTFCAASGKDEAQSNIVLSERLSVCQMYEGQTITLTWLPNRRCRVEYLGKGVFRVVEAEHTKLSVGDTFKCHLFVNHEPLYLDHLIHEGNHPTAYVAGRKDGIMFVME